jgi:hypothetical protein
VEDGYFVHHGIGKVDEFIYSGQDGGLGLAANNGWIYYSLSDEDPLFDLLPNGSYCFLARSGSAAQFDTTLRHISCDSQGCNEVVRAIPGAAMLIYSVGKLFMGHGGSMPGPYRWIFWRTGSHPAPWPGKMRKNASLRMG